MSQEKGNISSEVLLSAVVDKEEALTAQCGTGLLETAEM